MEPRFLREIYVLPDEGTNLWFLGQFVTFKIHGRSARVGVFQLITPPQGGIPPHRHAAQETPFSGARTFVLPTKYES
jgi:hypothetical protein